MKNLSIEEKSNRYDEAIKKAKDFYKGYKQRDNQLYADDLESIFPELKENNDEQIRKELISHFCGIRDNCGKDWYGYDINDVIAWLKKQGKNNMGISEVTKQKLEDNLNKALEKETAESWNKFLDEQGKQNPANSARTCKDEQNLAWSEEDEKIRQDIENLIHFALRDGSAVSPAADTTKEDAISWLKSLKDRYTWKPNDKQMKALNAINVTGGISYAGEGQELINLYKDLKKLEESSYD